MLLPPHSLDFGIYTIQCSGHSRVFIHSYLTHTLPSLIALPAAVLTSGRAMAYMPLEGFFRFN